MGQKSESLSKKRKCDDPEKLSKKPEKVKTVKSLLNTYEQHEIPLPLEWQRCLDIKSGEIYYYNTRTKKRTLSDPRTLNPEPSNPSPMSLNLELNLPCGSLEKNNNIQEQEENNFMMKQNSSGDVGAGSGLTRSSSWLIFEGEQQEMVTAVCQKCSMLVMMYKTSPACPNCKFMHQPEPDTRSSLFNDPRLSLLC